MSDNVNNPLTTTTDEEIAIRPLSIFLYLFEKNWEYPKDETPQRLKKTIALAIWRVFEEEWFGFDEKPFLKKIPERSGQPRNSELKTLVDWESLTEERQKVILEIEAFVLRITSSVETTTAVERI